MTASFITKEEIAHLSFVAAETERIDFWREKLEYAQRLGNEFKSKTSISFNTTAGIKTVSTTVWSLTENYIVLKAGIHIPLKSVVDIHF